MEKGKHLDKDLDIDFDVDLAKMKKHIHPSKIYEMLFLMNALDNGWTLKKKEDYYIFSKKHEGKKEILNNNYLEKFIQENISKNDKN